MKRIPFLAIVLLAFAFPAHAQDAMKKDAAVKPADPELKVVLDSWNEIGRKLTAMAEDFPEDKYDFKPTPAQRSFAEQLLHAAGASYYFTNPVMGQKPPAGEEPKRDQYKTKADIVLFVKKSVADGAASLCTTASQVLCRRSRGPISKAQETRYPVLIARRLREWAGILVFGTFSIQCAARHMDISAFVPLQDLGFGRRAARLAVQCGFRNEEETRSEFLSLIRQR